MGQLLVGLGRLTPMTLFAGHALSSVNRSVPVNKLILVPSRQGIDRLGLLVALYAGVCAPGDCAPRCQETDNKDQTDAQSFHASPPSQASGILSHVHTHFKEVYSFTTSRT